MQGKRLALVILVGGGTLLLEACNFQPAHTGPMETFPVDVPLGNSERAKIEINLSAGEVTLEGGGNSLLQGSIDYNVPAWKPQLHIVNVGSSTDVTIKQPEGHKLGGNVHYVWDLRVSNSPLLDIAINCGAGHQKLTLGETKLRSLKVNIGAGQVDVNLQGHPTRDYDVAISGGVGQATVRLPQGVGILAEAHGGIGSINVEGLQKKGDHWENELYDTAKVIVHAKVEGGIGEIRLIAN
jgi:hypothetical protein